MAEISGAVILPVAVEVISDVGAGMYENQLKTFVKKPDVKIHIGSPIKLEKVEGVERFSELMKKHSDIGRLTTEEFNDFSRIKKALESQSEFLMNKLSELLPDSEINN